MVLMSPPCQPFTRVGLKKDALDDRTCSFLHVLNLLPNLSTKLKYMLVENVKGFEKSETRNKLLAALEESNFIWQEFILSPTQFGIPNTRHRYYLIAKRKPLKFCFDTTELMEDLPMIKENIFNCNSSVCKHLKEVIGNYESEEYLKTFLLPDKVLGKRGWLLDIVTPESTRSCCFTKAYGHYVEGTGSVLSHQSREVVADTFQQSKAFEPETKEQLELLRSLELRYFTPQEVARLMRFPDGDFTFPDHANLTRKQKYRLLGNSINVHVVSKLIWILTEGDS